jgi:hypothetical protein
VGLDCVEGIHLSQGRENYLEFADTVINFGP